MTLVERLLQMSYKATNHIINQRKYLNAEGKFQMARTIIMTLRLIILNHSVLSFSIKCHHLKGNRSRNRHTGYTTHALIEEKL